MNPLQEATRGGDLEKVRELLKGNPALVFSKDTKGWTPLHLAVTYGHKDVMELLLANKAEINAKDNNGMTPLQLAVLNGNKELAVLLRQIGGLEKEVTVEKLKAHSGDWSNVIFSGMVVGVIMAVTRNQITGAGWLLPTGFAYVFCITNGNFQFSSAQRITATIVALVVGSYGQGIFSYFFKH